MEIGEGALIAITEINPIDIYDEKSAGPTVTYEFPAFEFRLSYHYEEPSVDWVTQAIQLQKRLRYYLIFVAGHGIPFRYWMLAKDSHAPSPPIGEQPNMASLVFLSHDISPEKVHKKYLTTYELTEKILEKIPQGIPMDTAIRSYGQSFTDNFEMAFIDLWRSLEVLILARPNSPTRLGKVKSTEIHLYLLDNGLSLDLSTIVRWRNLRNEIIHGRCTDEIVKDILDELEPLRNSIFKLLSDQVKDRYDLNITRLDLFL